LEGAIIVDDFLSRLLQREKEELEEFLNSALRTINLGFRGELVSIKRISYQHYEDVLEITHTVGNVAHINIAMNSIEATARVLFEYIITGNATGLIDNNFPE
jgi:hypothetical protein